MLRKCLIITNIFVTHKQYVKIKLMQNETMGGVFSGKDEILVKL